MSAVVEEPEKNDLTEDDEKKLSKKELNKLAKAAKIAELKAQVWCYYGVYCPEYILQKAAQNAAQTKEKEGEDVSAGMYGSYDMIQSADKKDVVFVQLNKISADSHGQEVKD